jgi:rhamnose transport system permease protein
VPIELAILLLFARSVVIEGGRGSIVGTMLAVLLLGLFTFAMGMANVAGIVMSMIVGVLLIVAMVLPRLSSSFAVFRPRAKA